MKHLLFIDFESYYDSSTYTLNQKRKGGMSILEYVRDAQFKAFGAGVCTVESKPAWITAEDLKPYFRQIAENVGWEHVAVVGHNIKFDGFILKEIYGITPGQYIDTLGMSMGVLGKTVKGHSLQVLSEHFGLSHGNVIGKGVMETDGKRDLTSEELTKLADYCLGDVDLTRQLFNKLAPEFPENQFAVLHRTVDMFINTKLQLDVPMLETLLKNETERRVKIFEEIGIPKSEFSSNVKFPKLLVAKGYTVPMKESKKARNPDGTPKMIPALALGDTEFLELRENGNEELQDLCDARIAAKSTMLETRSGKLLKIGKTGRWSFDVRYSGADQTQRFSGGPGAGGNPQQFTNPAKVKDPKKRAIAEMLRKSVAAPDGYELVVGDFAQIEFRIVAYLSKDPGLIQAIEQNTNIYCDFASTFYGRRITKLTDEKEYNFGKQAILGLGYGMGWEKFQTTVRVQTGMVITEEDARKAVDLYRTRYGGVKALWDALSNAIVWMTEPEGSPHHRLTSVPVTFGRECIILPSGLKIKFPNLRQVPSKKFKGQLEWVYDAWNKGHVETRKLYGGKVLENISQAIAGEICKEAMMRMDHSAVKFEPITGQVHDELHVLAKRGLGLVVRQKLKRAMTVSPSWFPQIKLDAEVHVGANWGSAK